MGTDEVYDSIFEGELKDDFDNKLDICIGKDDSGKWIDLLITNEQQEENFFRLKKKDIRRLIKELNELVKP